MLTPSEFTVQKTWVWLVLHNQSLQVPDNFLFDDPYGIRVLDADISNEESQAHMLTLRETGMYSFYCDKQLLFSPNHREEEMEGRLLVQ